MGKFALVLLLASGPALAPATAVAAVNIAQDEVTVRGENRVVCRRVTRTATRMRVGRVCRPLSQWRAESRAPAADDRHNGMDDTADTLETFGDKVSTNDVGTEGLLNPDFSAPLAEPH